MKYWITVVFCITVFHSFSQNVFSCDTVGEHSTGILHNVRIAGDSLASSFCIIIKNGVPAHYHRSHSEHVVVLSGKALMRLGDKKISVKPGDVIFIPRNTVHEVTVTSDIPLKVISVQAPYFDGTDRIMVKD